MAGRKENSGKSKAAKELPTLDRIIAGDSIEELAKLPDESVDLIFAAARAALSGEGAP